MRVFLFKDLEPIEEEFLLLLTLKF